MAWPASSKGKSSGSDDSARSSTSAQDNRVDAPVPPPVDWQSRPLTPSTDAACEAVLKGRGMSRPR